MSTQQVDLWKRDMFLAIQEGCSESIATIRKLIRTNAVDDIDSDIGPIPREDHPQKVPRCHTALTFAAWKGKLSVVKCLLEEGANPFALTAQGLAAIHCCCMKSSDEHLAVLKYFLEYPRLKLDVSFCNEQDGTTPLMYSSLYGSYSVAEYLLQQNAEVNRQDWEGKSAIFYAVRGGNLDVLQLLVAHNACTYLRDNNNATVLHYLLITFTRSVTPMNTLIDILTYLVEDRGLSVHSQAHDGSTALHAACHNGLNKAVSYLLDKGAGLEAKKNGWETPLWTLIMGRCPRSKLIMFMLEKGANFEARHCLGMTLMQYAKPVLKNEKLVTALEEALRALRAKRMKACLAKRKQILSFSSIKSLDGAPRLSPFLRGYRDAAVRWSEQTVEENGEKDYNAGNVEDALREINDIKPVVFGKVKIENEGATGTTDYDQETYSNISSDSFPSESDDESLTDDDDDEKDNDVSNTASEYIGREIEDSDMIARTRTTADATLEKHHEVSIFSEDVLPCSSEDDSESEDEEVNIDENMFGLKNVSSSPENLGFSNEVRESNENEGLSSVASSTSNTNGRNLDMKECFERLLRKKRLFDETNCQANSDDSNDNQEEGDPPAVPQKIQCVRRSAVICDILSDSD